MLSSCLRFALSKTGGAVTPSSPSAIPTANTTPPVASSAVASTMGSGFKQSSFSDGGAVQRTMRLPSSPGGRRAKIAAEIFRISGKCAALPAAPAAAVESPMMAFVGPMLAASYGIGYSYGDALAPDPNELKRLQLERLRGEVDAQVSDMERQRRLSDMKAMMDRESKDSTLRF